MSSQRDELVAGRTAIVNSIYDMSPPALEALAQWIEQRGISLPISQVVGYQQDRLVVKVRVTGGTQSITTAVTTNIIFPTTVVDKAHVFDGTSTYTLPVDGTYLASGSHSFVATAAVCWEAQMITQNGVTVAQQDKVTSGTVQAPSSAVSTLIVGAKGDLIRHATFQNSGGGLVVSNATFELALLNRY